ncbi:MAG: thioredoxin domain-containing protein [Bacteroidetes bacterium]|nr:thioredoxin domain-containing protein [Bacteroidota bacterium]
MSTIFNYLNILLLPLAMIAGSSVYSQEGIKFEKDTWSNTLAKAKAENKIVFVDAYTTWCGPCKMMDAITFSDEKVGDFFNTNFINIKVDVEKGDGLGIAEKYKVSGYPTLFFVNSDGELVHSSVGARSPEELINLGEMVAAMVKDSNKSFPSMEKRYLAGEGGSEFLKNYAYLLFDRRMEYQRVFDDYMKTQSDLLTEDNIKFISDFTRESSAPYYEFIIKHKAEFDKVVGKEVIDELFKTILFGEAMFKIKTEGDFDILEKNLLEVFNELEAKENLDIFKTFYYFNNAQMAKIQKSDKYPICKKKFFDSSVSYIEDHEIQDSEELNQQAFLIAELATIEDKEILEKALAWVKKSMDQDVNYANADTRALICYILARNEEAKKYAELAVNLGRKEGEDVSATLDLLKKIED